MLGSWGSSACIWPQAERSRGRLRAGENGELSAWAQHLAHGPDRTRSPSGLRRLQNPVSGWCRRPLGGDSADLGWTCHHCRRRRGATGASLASGRLKSLNGRNPGQRPPLAGWEPTLQPEGLSKEDRRARLGSPACGRPTSAACGCWPGPARRRRLGDRDDWGRGAPDRAVGRCQAAAAAARELVAGRPGALSAAVGGAERTGRYAKVGRARGRSAARGRVRSRTGSIGRGPHGRPPPGPGFQPRFDRGTTAASAGS
jgi:hypothetical protein